MLIFSYKGYPLKVKISEDCEKLLLKDDPKSKDLSKIDSLINSFKTIDYDNGIPYNWNDNDI